MLHNKTNTKYAKHSEALSVTVCGYFQTKGLRSKRQISPNIFQVVASLPTKALLCQQAQYIKRAIFRYVNQPGANTVETSQGQID
jgi:hypothetical protein